MKNKIHQFTILAIIVYCVGLAGFLIPVLKPYIVPLTPVNIVLAFVVALAFDKDLGLNKIFLLAGIAVTGFIVEYAGVYTGWIFGHYHYGKTLGPGFRDIPYIIGLNWAAMVLFCTQFFRFKKLPIWMISLLQAGLMTGFDYILEPVAVAFDFWTWDSGSIPARNYIAWFVISAIYTFTWNSSISFKKNEMSQRILMIQFVFFIILHLIVKLQWKLM